MGSHSLNTVEIDLAALRSNFEAVCNRVGSRVKVMAVVKANAYGHGLVRVTQALEQAGAKIFGVAEVEEGIRLREAGIKGDIVILLGVSSKCSDALIRHHLTPVVFDLPVLHQLSKAAVHAGRNLGVHLKIDTGMGRLGILPEETAQYVAAIEGLDNIYLAGLMSHFPMSDAQDSALTLEQCERFTEIIRTVMGVDREKVALHIANSGALLLYKETHLDMVRPGISLYGCMPGERFAGDTMAFYTPVMRFLSQVIQVKEVPAGYGLSYGHMFKTVRHTRLAVLPVGYADGYLRSLSGRAQVIIHGKRVPVLGRICMNACMADITDLKDVKIGDEVVLLGRQGDEQITAEELAGWMGTINYEVLCLLGSHHFHTYLN